MATRHKSERNNANLDYWGDVLYYESRDGILNSHWENIFTKKYECLRCYNFCCYFENVVSRCFSLSQLYWAVVLLQRDRRSDITYSPPNPNPTLDERADPGQN